MVDIFVFTFIVFLAAGFFIGSIYKIFISKIIIQAKLSSIFADMLGVTSKYYKLRNEGYFTTSSTITDSLEKGIDDFLAIGHSGLHKVKFASKLAPIPHADVNAVKKAELELWSEFNSLLLKLYKVNQPYSYVLLILKKIFIVQILSFATVAIFAKKFLSNFTKNLIGEYPENPINMKYTI